MSVGKPGMQSATRGLAEALDLDYEYKRVLFRWPRNWIPAVALAILPPALIDRLVARNSDSIGPPWPEVIVSLGWRCAGVAAAIRRASGGAVKVVHIQRPGLPCHWLDAVVVPKHDGMEAPNVVTTTTAIHPISPVVLAAAAREPDSRLAALPRPLVGVLVGGSTNRFRYVMTQASVGGLARKLRSMQAQDKVGLAILTSRRTPAFGREALQHLAEEPGIFFWDGTGDNPYLRLLAQADAFVVTADSVAMISEALATGKPVFIEPLPGRGSRRLRAFRDSIVAGGLARIFEGRMAKWSYSAQLGMSAISSRIRELLWPSGR